MDAMRLVALSAVLLLAGACSSGADDATPTTTAPTTTSALSPTTSTTAPPTTTAAPAVEIKLLTYNVAGLPDLLSGSEPAINTLLIGPRLNDYDLVLVQESWLTPAETPDDQRTYHEILVDLADHEFESASLPAPLGSDPERPSALLSDGLNRFSDYPFTPVERQRWTTCGEASADCLSLKGFSVATTTLGDGLEVDVYNLHLDAGRADFEIRAENVAELTAHILEHSAGRAVIVAGDFNLHLDRDPDADQFAALLADAGLIDVCTALSCDEPNRIDKVLVRSTDGLEITPIEWRNESAVFTRDDGEPLSDHDPVVARLQITAT
ncbi:MAG: endonuclease/exonuclease/phosphatase family protein [Acidimicrobiales bacterium]